MPLIDPIAAPHAIRTISGHHLRHGRVACVDILIHEPHRAIAKQGINAARMVATRTQHAARRIGVSIAIVDARRRIWREHRVERHILGLAVAPDRAELRFDLDADKLAVRRGRIADPGLLITDGRFAAVAVLTSSPLADRNV